MHSLEPLNEVTIAHSGLPPATEMLAAQFAGRACEGMFGLYVGYYERTLSEHSGDLTTFCRSLCYASNPMFSSIPYLP